MESTSVFFTVIGATSCCFATGHIENHSVCGGHWCKPLWEKRKQDRRRSSKLWKLSTNNTFSKWPLAQIFGSLFLFRYTSPLQILSSTKVAARTRREVGERRKCRSKCVNVVQAVALIPSRGRRNVEAACESVLRWNRGSLRFLTLFLTWSARRHMCLTKAMSLFRALWLSSMKIVLTSGQFCLSCPVHCRSFKLNRVVVVVVFCVSRTNRASTVRRAWPPPVKVTRRSQWAMRRHWAPPSTRSDPFLWASTPSWPASSSTAKVHTHATQRLEFVNMERRQWIWIPFVQAVMC